eukprot:TRINITY_DN44346_c0_g1_i1.p1 TRINITY_DN44346_c0_g1~~TRINITY_DN44346_c0_g1_i1.p1  ORF type:complete len:510 (+),score=36.49 TRINITY_DN44346_c0_g1_i1:168-1532(+)
MPAVFICLMYVGGFLFAAVSGWSFDRGYKFMASAMTGGAIVFPADNPQRFLSKFVACCASSAGVGLFGFTVAVLQNSLVGSIVSVLGLKPDDTDFKANLPNLCNIVRRLALLAFSMMVVNLIGACLFGLILSYLQGWEFLQGFKCIASVELGGGIQFRGMAVVSREGRLLYSIVGVWSLSAANLMIAIVGDVASLLLKRMTGLEHDGGSHSGARKKMAILVIIVLPATLFFCMMLVAVVMAPLTTWEFEGAFWAALPAVTGGAAALSSDKNPPLLPFGAFILVCAATAGFFLMTSVIGVGGALVAPIVEGSALKAYLGQRRTVRHSIVALLGISFFLIPMFVFLGSVLMGAIMSLSQGWPFLEGFWWCAAVQLGGGMALSSYQVHSFVGMLFGIVLVAWSIGISILSIGVSSCPIVEPLIEAFGLTVNTEELQQLNVLRSISSTLPRTSPPSTA